MKINSSGIFANTTKILAIHFTLFATFFLLIYYLANKTLIGIGPPVQNWDEEWYVSILNHGYQYDAGMQNNTAFFPLFPYFWRYTGLGNIGISIVNFFIFLLSFYLLVYFFKPKEKTQYLFLTIPCLLFFMIPYSESLFFLFSVLILGGMKTRNWWLTVAGFFMATLTRSAATIFIPALIGTAVFLSDKSMVKKKLVEYFLYITASVAATATVIYIQFAQTGVWFAAAKTQKHWDHYLRFPHFPLTSWSHPEVLRLDGTALLIGITALLSLLGLFVAKIKNGSPGLPNYSIFSLLYLGGITLSILLFQGGDLHSINRYIFATPFYFIFLFELEKKQVTIRQTAIALVLLVFYWLLLGSYTHILVFIKDLVLSVLIVSFLLIYTSSEKLAKWAFIFVYILTTICQAYLLVRYQKGSWIG